MNSRIVLLGAVDHHPERVAKLPKFLSVLCALADEVVLISSGCPEGYEDRVRWIRFEAEPAGNGRLGRFMASLWTQLRLVATLAFRVRRCRRLVALRRYMLPAVVARMLGMRPVRYHAGPSYRAGGRPGPINWLSEKLTNHVYWRIAVPSNGCVRQFSLEGFERKVAIGPFHLGPEFFAETGGLDQRQYTLGYFGNLTFASGGYRAVDNLIAAVQRLRNEGEEVTLVLGGVGPVATTFEDGTPPGIVFTGWLDHEQVRDWLDRTRILVLPSIDEGLATIALQAMARATPVLATRVAGNPDVIDDGVTGFMMEDASTEAIVDNVRRALASGDLKEIGRSGRQLVEERYTFRAVLVQWRRVLALEPG